MRIKILAGFVAGGLLVGAGFIASAVSSPGTALAQEDSDTEDFGPFPRILGFLDEVLDELVSEGTITEEQAGAVADAVEERAGEIRDGIRDGRENRQFRHPFKRGFRFGALLDDGGIDQEEYDGLPDDHPLKQTDVSEYLEDGQITPDELREIFRDLKEARDGDDA